MNYHKEQRKNEIYLGNTISKKFPSEKISKLKTIRLGEVAYDIHGKPLPKDDPYKPLFVDKSEYDEYHKIMEKEL